MAVRYLSVGGVDNPYRELQQSVNSVGQIFRDYDEDQRRRAENARSEFEYTQQLQERDRVNQQRTALAEYNPNIGQDFRGIDVSLRPHVEAQENTLRTQWEEANPNPTAEDRAAFERELGSTRASLASSEDVYSAVFDDVLRISQNPAYADTVAKAQAAQYRSRSAPIEQARANADAFNAAREKEADRRLELLKVEGQNRRSYGNNVVKLVDDLYGGTGRSSGGSGGGGSYSPDKYNFKTDAEFREVLQDRIGSWRDAPNALKHATSGFDEYNRLAREAGKPELSAHHKYQAIIEDVVEGGMFHNNKVRYSSGEDFAEILIRKFGLPDSDRDVNTAAAQSHNRTAGLNEVENILSSAYRAPSKEEQLAILNPRQVSVDVTKEQQRWVANAYYARWPELAKRSPVVMEQVTTAEAASTPAGNRASPPNQAGSRTGDQLPAGSPSSTEGARTDSGIIGGAAYTDFSQSGASTGNTANSASDTGRVPTADNAFLAAYPEDVQLLANTVYSFAQGNPRLVGPSAGAGIRNNQQVLANLRSTDPDKYAQVVEAVEVLNEAGNRRPVPVDVEGPEGRLQDVTSRLNMLDASFPKDPAEVERFVSLRPDIFELRNELLDNQRALEEEIARNNASNTQQSEDSRIRQAALSELPVDLDAYNRELANPRYSRPGTVPVSLPNRATVQQVAQSSPEVSEELNRMLQDMGVPVTLPGLLPSNTRRPRSVVLDPSQQQALIRRLDNLQNTYSRPAGSGVVVPQ